MTTRRACCFLCQIKIGQSPAHPFFAMESPYFVPESSLDFDTFRCGFGVCFRERIAQNLKTLLGSTMEISVPEFGDEARSNFFARVTENLSRPVHPMLHGTDPRNFPSILQLGFIIPDSSNDVPMRNGATYGKGVYFANINAPGLALQFCHGSLSLLVCAVLQDISVHAFADCQVVPDASFCVPLFIAKGQHGHANPSNAQSSLPLARVVGAADLLHCGYCMSLDIGNFLQHDVPVHQLLHDGYAPESLIAGGYSAGAVYEKRFHPAFGYVTFPGLQKLLPGVNCCTLWLRLSLHDGRDIVS